MEKSLSVALLTGTGGGLVEEEEENCYFKWNNTTNQTQYLAYKQVNSTAHTLS